MLSRASQAPLVPRSAPGRAGRQTTAEAVEAELAAESRQGASRSSIARRTHLGSHVGVPGTGCRGQSGQSVCANAALIVWLTLSLEWERRSSKACITPITSM